MENQETNDRGALESEEKQEFDAAFSEAEGTGTLDDPPQGNAAAEELKPAENLAAENIPGNQPEEQVGSPAESALPPGGDQSEQRYRTLQGMHRKDKETWEQKEQEYLAELEKLRASGPTESIAPDTKDGKAAGDSGLSEEDKAALKEYDDEFDTISRMETLKRNMLADALRQEIDAKLQNFFQQISPAISVGNNFAVERHLGAIREAHSDFETYRDNGSIQKWIDTKPAYLKNAYQHVYDDGSVEEVIDLISTFKTENNIGALPPGNQPPQQNNSRKEGRKAALSAVTNRRGAVNLHQFSSDDFEGAFEEAISK